MKVGSLVELVDDFNIYHKSYLTLNIPVKGVVYTVREIFEDSEGPSLRLVEVVNPVVNFQDGIDELCFDAACFRELLPPIANIEEHINENTLEEVLTA